MSISPIEYLQNLKSTFQEHGNPVTAEGQMNYMRNQFEFYGLKAKEWMGLSKQAFKDIGMFDGDNLKSFLQLCYEDEYREIQYAGTEMLQRKMKSEKEDLIFLLEELVTTKSWWDTVDWLAKLIGIHFQKFPNLRHPYCKKWIETDNIWLQRTAIICHRFDKTNTDVDLLFEMIIRRADSTEFFIRKAAGWALRDLSKTFPEKVVAFIDEHPELSNLTKREGLRLLKAKNLL